MKKIARKVYTYNTLLGAAKTFRKQATESKPFDNSMSSILLCALSLEAYLNHLGPQLFPIWTKHLERKLSPEGKLLVIALKIGHEIDFGKPPFQAFRTLFQFRNQLAHGQTEILDYENPKVWLYYGDRKWPASKWEVLCKPEVAADFVMNTADIINTLGSLSDREQVPSFLLSEHVEVDT